MTHTASLPYLECVRVLPVIACVSGQVVENKELSDMVVHVRSIARRIQLLIMGKSVGVG